MLPRENFEFRASETPFRAFWGEILQNSEDYNIIIRSRMPASSVIIANNKLDMKSVRCYPPVSGGGVPFLPPPLASATVE
jgi:hypothetical protein